MRCVEQLALNAVRCCVLTVTRSKLSITFAMLRWDRSMILPRSNRLASSTVRREKCGCLRYPGKRSSGNGDRTVGLWVCLHSDWSRVDGFDECMLWFRTESWKTDRRSLIVRLGSIGGCQAVRSGLGAAITSIRTVGD